MSDKLTKIFDRLYCDNQAKVYKLALGLTGDANDVISGFVTACSRAG